MAVQTRSLTRRLNFNGILIGLTVAGIFLAVLPIAAAIISGVTGRTGPSTAYASAPAGQYAVVAQSGIEADTILVAPVHDPSAVIEIASVPHMEGFYTRGAVAPDGRSAALIVVDGGTPAAPTASLVRVDLETGESAVLAREIDSLQSPVWAPDSSSVVVTRGGDQAPGTITLLSVPANGGAEAALQFVGGVLGLYPVGFDSLGRLVTVVIDGEGSTAYRNGAEPVHLGPSITRDWELNADGSAIAYVETNLQQGARYLPRVTSLVGEPGGVSAQSMALMSNEQALGASWNPASNAPVFGTEPGTGGESGSVLAQSMTADGFDVPIGYSADGRFLAVQHWNGESFTRPGDVSIELVSSDGRVRLDSATEFLGWAAR